MQKTDDCISINTQETFAWHMFSKLQRWYYEDSNKIIIFHKTAKVSSHYFTIPQFHRVNMGKKYPSEARYQVDKRKSIVPFLVSHDTI